MTLYEKSTIELICDQLEELFESHQWLSLTEPAIHQGLTLWNPDTNTLPLITIIPRLGKNEADRYGSITCAQPVEITALIPLAVGASAMIGQAVVAEMIKVIFRNRQHGWHGFPDELSGIKLLEHGIVQYPDEINPQMVSVGITLEITYEMELYHAPSEG